jgi:hypothetical protein
MRRTLKSLEKRVNDLKSWVGRMEAELQDKCDFEIGIEIFPGDGICIINPETSQVAPIMACIIEIERNGVLTAEKHDKLCI